jgi:hypothetical protein
MSNDVDLAELIIDALVGAKIISKEDFQKAVEIALEEILVDRLINSINVTTTKESNRIL